MPFSRVPVAFRSPTSTRALVYALVALVSAAVGVLAASCAHGTTRAADGTAAAAAEAAAATGTPARFTNHGEWVKYPRDTTGAATPDSIRAYVAYPERNSLAPAVIVIHEIFGLTDWEPRVADRLAQAGYVAIVPDLLSSKYGMTPPSADSGRKLVATLEPDRITTDLDATYAYLARQPSVKKADIGTIGFCWGGGQSFRYATNNPRLRAAVVCYGPAPDSAALARIRAPILGVYGENDARIDASLPEVERQMRSHGKAFTYHVYPGTGHGFLKPGRQGSDGPQVAAAWDRILGFYRETLGR